MHKIILKHKKYLLFILIISIISLLLGYFYFNILDNNIKLDIINNIKNNNIDINYIYKDLMIMSTIIITSFILIGSIISIIYYVYNIFIIGFLINIYINIYQTKSIIYIMIYLFINRLIPLILLIILIYKIFIMSINIINYIIKKNYSLKNNIVNNCKKCIYITIITMIMNIISYIVIPFLKV